MSFSRCIICDTEPRGCSLQHLWNRAITINNARLVLFKTVLNNWKNSQFLRVFTPVFRIQNMPDCNQPLLLTQSCFCDILICTLICQSTLLAHNTSSLKKNLSYKCHNILFTSLFSGATQRLIHQTMHCGTQKKLDRMRAHIIVNIFKLYRLFIFYISHNHI